MLGRGQLDHRLKINSIISKSSASVKGVSGLTQVVTYEQRKMLLQAGIDATDIFISAGMIEDKCQH